MLFHTKDEKIKNNLLCLRKVKIKKMRFTIKKVNPFLDFKSDKIPQIFTDFISNREIKTDRKLLPHEIKNFYDTMFSVIEAGLYEPKLIPMEKGETAWHEKGLTVRDLFLDEEIGITLYYEIMAHSLNRFKGLVGSFFLRSLKQVLLLQWPVNMEELHTRLLPLQVGGQTLK